MPSAVWPGLRSAAANGVDRSTNYDTSRLKLPEIGKNTYVQWV
jgi:hypothetical protein